MSRRFDDAPESWKSRFIWFAVLVAILLSHVYFVPYFGTLNNPNENSRVYQIRAWVELGKLSVNEQVQKYGWVNDLAKREGILYAGKAPATTFLGAPIYGALRWFDETRGAAPPSWFRIVFTLRLVGVILPCLLFVHLFRGLLRRVVHDARVADMLALILALGTMMMPNALLFVNHSLSAATAFGVVLAVNGALRVRRSTRASRFFLWARFAGAGFLLSATTALDYALFPVSLMLLGYVFWRAGWSWMSVVGTCLGALLPAGLTAAYHQLCWGSPFAVSMSFLANAQFAAEAGKGVFGIVGPTAESVWGVIGSAKKGLIYFSPVAALGLICVVLAALTSRFRKEATLTFAVVLWMLLYNVSLINWHAGWTVGPRYVTVIVPFVIFAIALCIRESKRSRPVMLSALVGLGIPSVVVTVATSTMFPHLQPDYDNPVFECIWPLWRDGFTPRSMGRWVADLSGHADQVVLLVVVGGLILWMILLVGRRWAAQRSWMVGVGGSISVMGLASMILWLQSLPETENKVRVERGMKWLTVQIWEPAPEGVRRPLSPRR